jgi:hypothetical protein
MKAQVLRFCAPIWAALLLLGLSACQTQHAFLRLGNEEQFEVYQPSRRQAWPFSRSMPYDRHFRVRDHRRSWTTAYNFPFFVVFSGAKEKFRFRFTGTLPEASDTFHAQVFCTARIREKDFPMFALGLPPLMINLMPPDRYSNFFFGQILPADTLHHGSGFFSIGEPQFIIMPGQVSEGYLMVEGRKFSIVGVTALRSIKGTRPVPVGQVVGFEVYDEVERPVLGVSAVNEGRVWLRKDLSAKDRYYLMALASALLLRRDLKSTHEAAKYGTLP